MVRPLTRSIRSPDNARVALLAFLLAPGVAILTCLLISPLAFMAVESFRPFVAGSFGAATGWTFANYVELLNSAYVFYFWETFRIAAVVSVIGLALATPLAWKTARTTSRTTRTALFGFLVGLLFLSIIARLYAVQMTWGSTGPLAGFGALIGVPVSSPAYAEVQVMIGLLHVVVPIGALTLIGTFQNISPRLEEAAASLGAPNWRTAITITLPLALPGLLSAFMITFAIGISNFVAPLVLGRGVVLFTTNLIYTRFTDIGNYPSGAAIGIVMLVLAFSLIYVISFFAQRLVKVDA